MEDKLSKRKQMRIPQYNYSNEGLYFITICTQNRKCILSQIHYNQNRFTYELTLLSYGKIVEKHIHSINETYNDIKITDYVIMPNHIHFICSILKQNSNNFNSPSNKKIPLLISSFKRLTNKECNLKIWQRNYYEHIIRNEKEYLKILEYIKENPYKWDNDMYFV